MIGEKFEFNNKSYIIKKDVSFGEYKKISKLGNALQGLLKEYEESDDMGKEQVLAKLSQTTDAQLDAIAEFLETILGLKDSELNKLPLVDAISLFNKTFIKSTQVKKKSEKTLNLPSS